MQCSGVRSSLSTSVEVRKHKVCSQEITNNPSLAEQDTLEPSLGRKVSWHWQVEMYA